MAEIDPFRYKYFARNEGNDWKWKRLKTVAHFKRMEKALKNAYLDHGLILDSMHDGLTVRTPFNHYQAIPIDAGSTG